MKATASEVAEIMAAERKSYMVPLDCFGRPLEGKAESGKQKAEMPTADLVIDNELVNKTKDEEDKMSKQVDGVENSQDTKKGTGSKMAAYWARMTPEERSEEVRRRMAVARGKKEDTESGRRGDAETGNGQKQGCKLETGKAPEDDDEISITPAGERELLKLRLSECAAARLTATERPAAEATARAWLIWQLEITRARVAAIQEILRLCGGA